MSESITWNGEPLLTTVETAELLGMNDGSLRNARSSGRSRLPVLKIGRHVYYRRADVEALAEALQTLAALRDAR